MTDCSKCGGDAWDGLIITAHVSPGPREDAGSIAVRPTLTPAFAACAECLYSPWGAGLRDLISDPASVTTVGVGRDCITVCRGKPVRGWTMITWELVHRWKCPRCMRRTRIWTAEQAPPTAISVLLLAAPRRISGAFRRARPAGIEHGGHGQDEMEPASGRGLDRGDSPPPRIMFG